MPSLTGAGTSLDSKPADRVQLGGCPDGRGWTWVRVDGTDAWECIARMCRRHTCAYCCPITVRQVGWAITQAKPDGLLTLTSVGVDWSTAKANVASVTIRVRKLGFPIEHAYTVEPHEDGEGLHAHLYVRGAGRIPCHVLAGVCADVSIGSPDLQRPLDLHGPQDYGMKGAKYDDTRADHLRLNGGRPIHNTRGFFLDRNGRPCTMTQAIGRRS